jgi:hypothetical protein
MAAIDNPGEGRVIQGSGSRLSPVGGPVSLDGYGTQGQEKIGQMGTTLDVSNQIFHFLGESRDDFEADQFLDCGEDFRTTQTRDAFHFCLHGGDGQIRTLNPNTCNKVMDQFDPGLGFPFRRGPGILQLTLHQHPMISEVEGIHFDFSRVDYFSPSHWIPFQLIFT